MTGMCKRKMLCEWRQRIVVRLRKRMRQQRGLQLMIDATERMGIYDAELADLAHLFDREKVNNGQFAKRVIECGVAICRGSDSALQR